MKFAEKLPGNVSSTDFTFVLITSFAVLHIQNNKYSYFMRNNKPVLYKIGNLSEKCIQNNGTQGTFIGPVVEFQGKIQHKAP